MFELMKAGRLKLGWRRVVLFVVLCTLTLRSATGSDSFVLNTYLPAASNKVATGMFVDDLSYVSITSATLGEANVNTIPSNVVAFCPTSGATATTANYVLVGESLNKIDQTFHICVRVRLTISDGEVYVEQTTVTRASPTPTCGDITNQGGQNPATSDTGSQAGVRSITIEARSVPPTAAPTTSPTSDGTQPPSEIPTEAPSLIPSVDPSVTPSVAPSAAPSATPSVTPSAQQPSIDPSVSPSAEPSVMPSAIPSARPSRVPSQAPSVRPSRPPSVKPSFRPTPQPTVVFSGVVIGANLTIDTVNIGTLGGRRRLERAGSMKLMEVSDNVIITAVANVLGLSEEDASIESEHIVSSEDNIATVLVELRILTSAQGFPSYEACFVFYRAALETAVGTNALLDVLVDTAESLDAYELRNITAVNFTSVVNAAAINTAMSDSGDDATTAGFIVGVVIGAVVGFIIFAVSMYLCVSRLVGRDAKVLAT